MNVSFVGPQRGDLGGGGGHGASAPMMWQIVFRFLTLSFLVPFVVPGVTSGVLGSPDGGLCSDSNVRRLGENKRCLAKTKQLVFLLSSVTQLLVLSLN